MKLTFDHLSASYCGKTVLDRVSFTTDSGTIAALTGRNGAGKSTLVRCLTGEKQDYHGTILLGGQDVRRMDLHTRSRQLACMPQVLPRPHVTVRELVLFGRTPYTSLMGTLSSSDRDAAAQALHAVGMEPFAEAFVDKLSGGERKKAFFAMTLAQDTPVVVLDEPTAHLDVVSRFEFLDLLETVRQATGKTFLLVMHDLPEILRCADQIVTLHEKTVAFAGDAESFLVERIPQTCFHVNLTGNRRQGYALQPLRSSAPDDGAD